MRDFFWFAGNRFRKIEKFCKFFDFANLEKPGFGPKGPKPNFLIHSFVGFADKTGFFFNF